MRTPDEREVAGLKCGDVLAALSDFLDGEVGRTKREQIIEHLRGCNWCETFGGRFSEIVEALRRELGEPAPLRADIAARLRQRLSKEPK